jgi:hypothetical protein
VLTHATSLAIIATFLAIRFLYDEMQTAFQHTFDSSGNRFISFWVVDWLALILMVVGTEDEPDLPPISHFSPSATKSAKTFNYDVEIIPHTIRAPATMPHMPMT